MDTSRMMTSKTSIICFTIFGIAFYLFTFLGIVLGTSASMDTWKIYTGAIGGAASFGFLIPAVLILMRKIFIETNSEQPDNSK